MRRGRRKDFYRRGEGLLRWPHEEAEIQRKALRQGKNLAFSIDTCLEKERVRSKVTPGKVGVGLKWRWELSRKRLGWRLAWWGFTEKASHLLGLRGRKGFLGPVDKQLPLKEAQNAKRKQLEQTQPKKAIVSSFAAQAC